MPTRNISLTHKQDELVERLRTQIELGVSALDNGNATEIDESELDSYLGELGAPRAHAARRPR